MIGPTCWHSLFRTAFNMLKRGGGVGPFFIQVGLDCNSTPHLECCIYIAPLPMLSSYSFMHRNSYSSFLVSHQSSPFSSTSYFNQFNTTSNHLPRLHFETFPPSAKFPGHKSRRSSPEVQTQDCSSAGLQTPQQPLPACSTLLLLHNAAPNTNLLPHP